MLPLFFEFDKESGFCPVVENFYHLLALKGNLVSAKCFVQKVCCLYCFVTIKISFLTENLVKVVFLLSFD